MPKTKPFSIYLLKRNFDATNSLKDDHLLIQAEQPDNLPAGGLLYLLDSAPTRPWWRAYLGVREELVQQNKGALLFLPVADRWFALSFGYVFHHLKDIAFEYDFGLRVTLNSLDPKEIKSADMVSPGVARRKRTQVPVSTDLTYLDFDGNSEVIKSLTGKVKQEHVDFFKNATGSISLKVSLKLNPGELSDICEKLLGLYESEEYKETFPNIQNIAPVRDPEIIDRLDTVLLDAFHKKDENLKLNIPDIVDYRDNTSCVFTGGNEYSDIFPDITIEFFYKYIETYIDIGIANIANLKEYQMVLTDIEGRPHRSYGIYRSLLFDVIADQEGVVYHFCDGSWYKIDQRYARKLKNYLDNKCEDPDLCPYNHDEHADDKIKYSEENYNKSIPNWNNEFICLDRTDISPVGTTELEPCDLYRVMDDNSAPRGHRGVLYHVKISTRSTHLSHLFNQGVNSIELIKREPDSRAKLIELITARVSPENVEKYTFPITDLKYKVVFAIITHADKENKSDNLPLFSKISLMRNMQQLDLYEVPSALVFVQDGSDKKVGHKRYREIIVEVYAGPHNKPEVRALANQGIDPNREINRCARAVSMSPLGTRYKIGVKINPDGSLSSHHTWPVEHLADELAH